MSANDLAGLRGEPLDIGAAVAFVSVPEAGGIALFAGTTRAETSPAGKALIALDYEAYAEMATAQLLDLAAQARARWPIIRLVVLHRTGQVGLAEPSVVIAVSTPHRADAFEACRWLIDTLKSQATIWKKEIWHDGAQTWVETHARGSHSL